ncbi:MAG: hypothetical protein F2663_05470 [Actinobacteria bacterium]|nr:hypothetical protein [Actinomycetota bacterium]
MRCSMLRERCGRFTSHSTPSFRFSRPTLSRGEAYEFLKLGCHLERADVIARILDVQYPSASMYLAESREETVGLTALVKSCGAFEAFRKAENPVLRAERVLEFLLLDEACPRSVLFCLNACLGSLSAIAGSSDRAERAIGRLASELSFLDTSSLSGEGARGLLHRVLGAIADASSEIENTYFTTRVIVAGAYAQAQQQQ